MLVATRISIATYQSTIDSAIALGNDRWWQGQSPALFISLHF